MVLAAVVLDPKVVVIGTIALVQPSVAPHPVLVAHTVSEELELVERAGSYSDLQRGLRIDWL